MKGQTERRAYKRCSLNATILCAHFNSDRFYHAQAVNHSQEGLNLVSDFPLKTGASIYVRVDYLAHGNHRTGICDCGGIRQIGLAEVKWCRELPDDYGSLYKIGLKYQEPAI